MEDYRFSHRLRVRYSEIDGQKAKTTLEFKRPARLDDWLNIWCRTSEIGRSSMKIDFVINRDEETDPLVIAQTVYVSYDAEKGTSRPIPDFVQQRIEQYERGE